MLGSSEGYFFKIHNASGFAILVCEYLSIIIFIYLYCSQQQWDIVVTKSLFKPAANNNLYY